MKEYFFTDETKQKTKEYLENLQNNKKFKCCEICGKNLWTRSETPLQIQAIQNKRFEDYYILMMINCDTCGNTRLFCHENLDKIIIREIESPIKKKEIIYNPSLLQKIRNWFKK